MQLIDLSQTIHAEMQLFSQHAPKPQIQPWMSHAQAAASGNYQDCTCEITEVKMVTSLGTYLDSPFHFDPTGPSIEQLALDQLVLPGIVIDCTHIASKQPISPAVLAGIDITDKAVLFHTGWSQYWGHPTYYDFPFVPAETAQALVNEHTKLAGVDFLVIDDTTDPIRPAHNILLKNNILIVENLTNLKQLPMDGFTFHAAPIKIVGAAAFPVRAYASVLGASS